MQAFKNFTGIVAPLDRSNVDTDSILPKQYLKSIKRTGFGPNLFDEWRYLDAGEPGEDHSKRRENPDFVLNQPRYKQAQILLARENFGCGSSREHAVWSFLDYGISVIIAPSFADIFYSNSFKNGLLPVMLDADIIDSLFKEVASTPGYVLMVNLEQNRIVRPDGGEIIFELDAGLQKRLLQGLDDISITLTHAEDIKRYEASRQKEVPWLFPESAAQG